MILMNPYRGGLDYAKLQTVRDAFGVMSQFGEPFGLYAPDQYIDCSFATVSEQRLKIEVDHNL